MKFDEYKKSDYKLMYIKKMNALY